MKASSCPRCNSTQVQKLADSPVRDKFEIYGCGACNFVWRSNEDLTDIDRRIDYLRENVTSNKCM